MFNKKASVLLSVLLLLPIVAFSKIYVDRVEKKTENELGLNCEAAKEFVTSMSYLRLKSKKIGLNEKQIRKISSKVSNGCNGSAKRFVRVFELLLENGLQANQSIAMAVVFANKKNENTDAFFEAFKSAYLKKNLDLSLVESVRLAKILTLDIEGDPIVGVIDFKEVMMFCMKNEKISLSKLYCAGLAEKVSLSSVKYKKSISKEFIELVNYLLTVEKAKITIKDSISWGEKAMRYGSLAGKNFIKSFEYAMSKEGLDFSVNRSLRFALKISKQSFKEDENSLQK